MRKFFSKFLTALLLAALVAGGFALWRTDDPIYILQEWWNGGRWSHYDSLIKNSGKRYGVDPALIKAVVWQESRFGPRKIGLAGERGLMQITEAAAADWAKANGEDFFDPESLLKPEVNLNVGAWYLRRGLDHYQGKDSPVPFALSEYNAGRTRVKRWIRQEDAGDKPMSAEEMKSKSFESTRAYVESIEQRYEFYLKRGRL